MKDTEQLFHLNLNNVKKPSWFRKRMSNHLGLHLQIELANDFENGIPSLSFVLSVMLDVIFSVIVHTVYKCM